MGWDDFSNGGRDLQDNREIIDTLSKQDVGKKVYECVEEVTFIVKYKVVAKDRSELINNKPGLSFCNLEVKKHLLENNDNKKDMTYDYRIRCCESKELEEPYESIDEVVEKFEQDEEGNDMKWSAYLDIEHKGL
tara:strand:+ start:2831 stop:3232 length:402 start_codon:yes stop_codon:yes gene_type:complete